VTEVRLEQGGGVGGVRAREELEDEGGCRSVWAEAEGRRGDDSDGGVGEGLEDVPSKTRGVRASGPSERADRQREHAGKGPKIGVSGRGGARYQAKSSQVKSYALGDVAGKAHEERLGLSDGVGGVPETGWDGTGWDGMGWDGMGWDGMGWDGMGWDGRRSACTTCCQPYGST
jgi:hypothetical protein